jgi:hypothetical protein
MIYDSFLKGLKQILHPKYFRSGGIVILEKIL